MIGEDSMPQEAVEVCTGGVESVGATQNRHGRVRHLSLDLPYPQAA